MGNWGRVKPAWALPGAVAIKGRDQLAKGYLVAHIRVHDVEVFQEFRGVAGAAVTEHGGRILVGNPVADFREGDVRGVTIVIEFDDLATATRFYESEAYTAARAIREKGAETDLLLVEGV